ncbi:hypothetical protein ABRY23_14205 [Melioribacteraceae bacterium 4301-Me]|uniref:hypothetical protein n=1 Tax=Pyranulibacter aquaticus TaxID=3163344 RepID=UPI003598944A
MKPVICIYCEGSDTKLAVVSKEKETLKILRVASLNMSEALISPLSKHDIEGSLNSISLSEDINFENLDELDSGTPSYKDTSDISRLNDALAGLALKRLQFIPIISEPTVNFHLYEGQRELSKKKLIDNIIKDIQEVKGISVSPDSLDYIEMNDKALLSLFIEGDLPCVNLVNLLANYNKRRYYKIPTIKTAELSLAYYVSKTNQFFPEDHTLIIYIGKEYSKLIFLEGQNLKHIGATLDIGTKNLHTYDVYFSKILLEMENGGINKLDNIIVCGEDRSENLLLSFYGTFPEANVSELKFDPFDLELINEDERKNLALYAIPLSVAVEYFDELNKEYSGVNFLPKYIQENQKFLQFGWHSYALLPVLFATAFFFTFRILSTYQEMKKLDMEIEKLTLRQSQNQALADQITPLSIRINNFDKTQAILDSAAVGTEVWTKTLSLISDFVERRRNFWVTKLDDSENKEIKITGYSLSRSVLTEFAQYANRAVLKNINYEPLRDKTAFSYTIGFKINEDSNKVNGK